MSTNKFITLNNGEKVLVVAPNTSAGVSTANQIVSTGTDGKIHSTFLPAGLGAGTINLVTTETLSAGSFVSIYSDAGVDKIRLADGANGRRARGFVLSAATVGQTVTVILQGLNTALTGLIADASSDPFLSVTTPGTHTLVAPSASGQIIQSLGYVIGGSIYFEYDQPILIQ